MICKKIILPFLVLTTTTLSQSINAEILIVRKSIPQTIAAPSSPVVMQASYMPSENTTHVVPASFSAPSQSVVKNVPTSYSQPTQYKPQNSTAGKEFNAPSFATSVSPQNSKTFSANIPQYSTGIYLKNPPHYVGCFYSSSRKYGVPADLLMAIAQTESSFRHEVKGQLGWGADHGLMQINDYWVPKLRKRFSISLSDIYDPCTNIEIASWILAHNFVQFGYSWRAVGAYNAVTEWKRVRYINKVAANLKKLHAGQL